MDSTFIIPYRIIPFDIGGDISSKEIDNIIKKYNEVNDDSQIEKYEINKFHESLSSRLIGGYKITDKIFLFIYSFGVGVFEVQDENFLFSSMNSNFAVNYCKSRREAHNVILDFKAVFSQSLKEIIDFIRKQYILYDKKTRLTASSKWEKNGLSYVMTVTYINTCIDESNYDTMTDNEKRSLQIMLTPSLAHEEDSAFIKLPNSEVNSDPYSIDIKMLQNPQNFWKSNGADIYISWAAVVVMQKTIQEEYIKFINSLEIDLQAMWLYTYCLYCNLKKNFGTTKMLVSEMKHMANEFERLYNDFLSNNDSCCPQYVQDIRNELIKTSGIQQEHDKFTEHISYCIDEAETLEREHQRKYAWLTEILLFIIAFADIITTLVTNFIVNMAFSYQVAFAVISIIVFISGIVFVVKKG